MAFCSKCGNQMEDNAKFCPVCGAGTEVSVAQETNQPENMQGGQPEVNQQVVQPRENQQFVQQDVTQSAYQNMQPNFNTYQQTPIKKKFNPLKVIIPVVSGVLVIVIVLGIVIFNGKQKIVTTNKDGEKVFNCNMEEFIEKYNEANEDEMKLSYFEKDINSDGELIYTMSDSFIVIFVGQDDYNDNIETIKLNIDYRDEDYIANGVVYFIKAFYPELAYSDALEIASDAKVWGFGNSYKDVNVTYKHDDADDYESWYISAKE